MPSYVLPPVFLNEIILKSDIGLRNWLLKIKNIYHYFYWFLFYIKKIRYPKNSRENMFWIYLSRTDDIFFGPVLWWSHKRRYFFWFLPSFWSDSITVMISTNQIHRISRIRNRTQPPISPNQNADSFVFTPKRKYENSFTNTDGVLFLSKRKRLPPTTEELERRK